MNVRIIRRLDIEGASLVKDIHLEGLRVLSTPELSAREIRCGAAPELSDRFRSPHLWKKRGGEWCVA